jgi:uracil phosphoribosyltransferase
MSNVHLSRHPLVLDAVARLRDQATPSPQFRKLVHDLSHLLFIEAANDLALEPISVTTPLAACEGQRLREAIGVVPILRAGLGMAEAILEMLPEAQVWHLGLYRDHRTLKPIAYYNKLNNKTRLDVAYVVDPMLATGGSAVAAIDELKKWGVRRIKMLALIAAPEGVHAIHAKHPDVALHLAALDSHLNEHGYIVPGLGDAGDRQFGTLTE